MILNRPFEYTENPAYILLPMKLLTFNRGVHPPGNKSRTENVPVRSLSDPSEIVVPLIQHIGAPNKSLVKKKDEVKVGQMIGDIGAFVACPVHSPVSGKVKSVERRPHSSGTSVESVVIKPDGKNELAEVPEIKGLEEMTPEEIRQIIRRAGLSGMGGASFPTHVKLTPPKDAPINAVILNAAECEPYITADHRLMVEQSEKIVFGLKVFQKALGAEKAYIGIENNKPDAVDAMQKAIENDGAEMEIKRLEVKYPQGAEKMLIKAVVDKEVPSGKIPAHAGVLVQNVGTAAAAADIIRKGTPLLERIVTVSGRGIKEPANLLVKIGTSIGHCIEACGGLTDDARKVLVGGPMMGTPIANLDIPVVKGTSGIVALVEEELITIKSRNCIGCGRCVSVCPIGLLPTRLARFSEHRLLDKAEQFGLFDCIECGSCTYVCPSAIPLIQWIRHGKYQVMEERKRIASGGSKRN